MNEVEQKKRDFSFGPEYLAMDPSNYDGATEELEYEWRRPAAVVEKKGRRIELHQILRIRAEDLHMRQDHIGENLRMKERNGVVHFMLSASPLSGKTAY